MEGYNSMVFYSSFYESIQKIPEDMPEMRLKLYEAIFEYGLYGIEPQLEWPLSMAWESIKPQIDANIKRRENGQKGGFQKAKNNVVSSGKTLAKSSKGVATSSKGLANSGKGVANVNVNVNDNVNINDNIYDNDNDDDNETELPVAVKYYIDYINPTPSAGLINTIESYISDGMTDDCLIAIFEYCRDNNKTNWSYIKKAVEGCFNQGIRTEEDYRQSRQAYEQSKGSQRTEYKAETGSRLGPASRRKSSFHNFEQRDYAPNEFDDICYAEMYGFPPESSMNKETGLTTE